MLLCHNPCPSGDGTFSSVSFPLAKESSQLGNTGTGRETEFKLNLPFFLFLTELGPTKEKKRKLVKFGNDLILGNPRWHQHPPAQRCLSELEQNWQQSQKL